MEKIKESWVTIVDSVSKKKISVGTYLSEGLPVKAAGQVLTVSFPKNFSLHKESLERRENRELIEMTISEICRVPLRLAFILSEGHQSPRPLDNPMLKSALDAFEGRVIKEE